MALSTHDKTLIGVAISVAAGCRPCTSHYLGEARKAGASGTAIENAVAQAVCVRTSATAGMRRHALDLPPTDEGCGCAAAERLDELIALGAALAVNCTANVDKHLAAVRALEVPQADIDEMAAMATHIRSQAIRRAEGRLGAEAPQQGPLAAPQTFGKWC